ncbi:MAG: MBOAT family O-acyltransferase [Sulfurovum sp.]|nr:MBOAT family O-acyltransferase [Sulfurovum sp.]
MLFNSYEFIFFFLPFTFFIYFYLNKKHLTEASKAFLVLASLFFYSFFEIMNLPLLILSIVFNYFLGKKLAQDIPKSHFFHAKMLLTLGISFNLLLLIYYKYMDFFIFNANRAFETELPMMHVVLPLAISFYTFQQIAYLVDSYRKETTEYNFLNYASFVTFFPQLIAGPIVHHSEMMPQFSKTKNKLANYYNIALGLFIFSMGLFKKVVIADSFGNWSRMGFDATHLNMLEAWVASLSGTFQIYFDFSGYTDMAIGIALLFNIRLPINFFSPYKATSIQDFWRRWHITLSRFLKEYVYIPLGGNRKSEIRTYTNLFATFVLGGIWHGAGWPFLLWGILHGGALVIHRFWQRLGLKMPSILAWFITFNFINITWVFFNAGLHGGNFAVAKKVLLAMFTGELVLPKPIADFLGDAVIVGYWSKLYASEFWLLLWLGAGFVIVLSFDNSIQWMKKFKTNVFYMVLTLFFFSAIFFLYKKSEFIYFNF